jgi:hypothetical protein
MEGKDFTSAFFLCHHAKTSLLALQQNSSVQVELDTVLVYSKVIIIKSGVFGSLI